MKRPELETYTRVLHVRPDAMEGFSYEQEKHLGYPRKEADTFMNWQEEQILNLHKELNRKNAQIMEALAILNDGTDYEKLHVAAILRNGLGKP